MALRGVGDLKDTGAHDERPLVSAPGKAPPRAPASPLEEPATLLVGYNSRPVLMRCIKETEWPRES